MASSSNSDNKIKIGLYSYPEGREATRLPDRLPTWDQSCLYIGLRLVHKGRGLWLHGVCVIFCVHGQLAVLGFATFTTVCRHHLF